MTRPTTFAIALGGSMLMWAALPPLALGWLGWIAPVPWLVLVRRERLVGRRPYRALWFAGFVFWMASIHWLRLPHPAVYLGWIALSAYLAVYLPLFVGLSRVAVHRLRLPLWIAAPVVWTGLELARAHVMTGFTMGSLAHTQARWPAVIQISDLVGEYGVDFVMMLVAASITCLVFSPRRPLAVVPAAIAVAATLFYGQWRLSESEIINHQSSINNRELVRIALIQGDSLADWKYDTARQQEIMREYVRLSRDALAKARDLDGRPVELVVWPETMFRSALRTFEPGYQLPASAEQTTEEIAAVGPRDLANLARELGTPVLVGVDRVHFLADEASATDTPHYRAYNSAALVGRDGRIVGTYDKVHLVMFGEYVPFSKWLPVLDRISSITGTAEAGVGPVALCVDGVCYSPSICYETVIPHVIRRQVAELPQTDVLVNLTNDAWYWGSSELDMHLACDVFRAVETRRPLVVAANGGISAWVDRHGRIRAQSPRQQTDVILADVELNRDARPTVYVRAGDWFAAACLTSCVALAIIGWRGRRVSQ
jgi:apolipoprotein N-acyltransferase